MFVFLAREREREKTTTKEKRAESKGKEGGRPCRKAGLARQGGAEFRGPDCSSVLKKTARVCVNKGYCVNEFFRLPDAADMDVCVPRVIAGTRTDRIYSAKTRVVRTRITSHRGVARAFEEE